MTCDTYFNSHFTNFLQNSPAELESFAFVDFSARNSSFLHEFFNVASQHKMKMPSRELIEPCRVEIHRNERNVGQHMVNDMVAEAIRKAKAVFLGDSTKYFSKNNSWFRTRVRSPDGLQSKCLVLDWFEEEQIVVLMLPSNEVFHSHQIICKGKEMGVRMMVKVSETDTLIDPFDCDVDENGFKAKINGEFQRAHFRQCCYQLQDGSILSEADVEISEISYTIEVPEERVDCPAILFAIMDTNDLQNDKYAYIKYLCLYKYGIQSQCIAFNQYDKQKSKEQ